MGLFAKRRDEIMRGMHIKGHPSLAPRLARQTFPREGILPEGGGLEATVTTRKMLADNTFEGDA